jgi:hypothetical protein
LIAQNETRSHTHQSPTPPKMSSAEDLLAMFSTMKTTDHSTLISQFCTVRHVFSSLTTHSVECSRGRTTKNIRGITTSRWTAIVAPGFHPLLTNHPPHTARSHWVIPYVSLLSKLGLSRRGGRAGGVLPRSIELEPSGEFSFFARTSWCNITLLSRLFGPFRKRSPLRMLVF